MHTDTRGPVILLLVLTSILSAQGTAPVFRQKLGQASYTLLGNDPASESTTSIPTLLVPITLSFDAKKTGGKSFVMDAGPDLAAVLHSPVFAQFAFPSGGTTQYGDALLRTTLPGFANWHTLLGKPEVKPVKIDVPVGYGYILTSKRSGGALAVADIEFLQKELFKQIPKQTGKLVIAITHNVTYYADADATLCCSWGTHGVDSATGNSFVIGSYLHGAPAIVEDADIQPLTQQLGEYINDPLHDPLLHGRNVKAPGNVFASWLRVQGSCGGNGVASPYFLLEPTNTNPKNNFASSKAFVARVGTATYHLQNVALLPWYTGATESGYSFPDAKALTEPAKPCPKFGGLFSPSLPKAAAIAAAPNGHQLIGYWSKSFPLRDVSPQWDVIIVAFATPDHNAPEGTMRFQPPSGGAEQFKSDVAYLKSKGKKVMISLGGGGQYFSLADPKSLSNFVSSVAQVIKEYGFDGIDIDFETPSLNIDPGDTDFKHPVTPSIVNLVAGMRQLHDQFGPGFMISLVPEGTQVPSGYPSYGGQFGSYLPILQGIRDILSFVDVQDYNTPPLEGLDGEIYQPGSVDYHAAMTELLLHGFDAGGDPKQFFAPVPADKVAIGFLTEDTTPAIVSQAMDYLITGKPPAGTHYRLRQPGGYPGMIGAMFWTIDADRRGGYNFSNAAGPQLHSYPRTSGIQ